MTKLTKEQAVSAVQTATTHEAIKAVLMNCTKAVMAEVYEAVTGQPAASLHIKSTDKKYQAEIYAVKIIRYRTDEAFKAKPFDEKFEMLLAAKTMYARIEQIGFYFEIVTEKGRKAPAFRHGDIRPVLFIFCLVLFILYMYNTLMQYKSNHNVVYSCQF